jgi:hypothetical protein
VSVKLKIVLLNAKYIIILLTFVLPPPLSFMLSFKLTPHCHTLLPFSNLSNEKIMLGLEGGCFINWIDSQLVS